MTADGSRHGGTVGRTHLGPVLDERVAAARRRVRVDAGPDYELVSRGFDFLHYLLRTPRLIEEPDVDLVQHFLDHGVEEDRSPEPGFAMAAYLERHPERAEDPGTNPYVAWLRHGRAADEVADPAPAIEAAARVLGTSPVELAERYGEVRADVTQRLLTGTLGEMFAKAAEVEPLVSAAWLRATTPNIPPCVAPHVVHQISAVHACQEEAGFRRARMVVVLNRPRWGGGRRMEGHLAHALTRGHLDPDDIVVIHTDETGTTPPGRYPEGVREVDFATAAAPMGSWVAQRSLVELVRSFHADVVVNINSRLFHEAMLSFGDALAATERLFSVFFCGERTARGSWIGYPFRHFWRTFDNLTGVVTDSAHWRNWFCEAYQVGGPLAEKLHVFDAPVDRSVPPARRPVRRGRRRRPRVYWAGRWDRQKRIGLVRAIARRMPDVDFLLWGEAVLDGSGVDRMPSNVRLQGRYGHLSEVDLGDADVWLYTSGWDGVPSQLLEVGLTGVPVVATEVGGTGEVLSHDDAWLVPADEGAPAYEEAIRDVLADPERADRRAAALRERLLRERTEEEFAAHVARVLLPDGPARPTQRPAQRPTQQPTQGSTQPPAEETAS